MHYFKKLEIPLFILFFSLALWASKPSSEESYIYKGDDVRYIYYAVSMHQHGVFGLRGETPEAAPPPGNANAPFYPALITGMMLINKSFADSLVCLKVKGQKAHCPQNFEVFFITQVALGVLSLYLIYLLSVCISGQKTVGWLAAILALASGIFQEFSFIFMTETLILPVFITLLLCCLKLYQTPKWQWVVVIGLSLAVLTLIRPSYLYLFYGFILFFIAVLAVHRNKRSALNLGALVLTFVVAVSPWALRNKSHFDSFSLTAGDYAEAILIQRTNYNQMSWPEVGAAMVFWLPDFGDSLAEKIFTKEKTAKLGWGNNSYYGQQYADKLKNLSTDLGGKDKVLGYLVREEILTLKHIVVSIPLAVRGTFIAKYWGVIGFIAFVALSIRTIRQKNYAVVVLALPLFFMVAFHAGLSVSIPRYNLPLIALYSLCMAWYINFFGQRIVKKIKT